MTKKIHEKIASLIIVDLVNIEKKDYNRMMKWLKKLPSDIERYKKMNLRTCKNFRFSIMNSKNVK